LPKGDKLNQPSGGARLTWGWGGVCDKLPWLKYVGNDGKLKWLRCLDSQISSPYCFCIEREGSSVPLEEVSPLKNFSTALGGR